MTMNDSYIGFQIKQTHNLFMAIINKQMDFLMISILRQKYIVDIYQTRFYTWRHTLILRLLGAHLCVYLDDKLAIK